LKVVCSNLRPQFFSFQFVLKGFHTQDTFYYIRFISIRYHTGVIGNLIVAQITISVVQYKFRAFRLLISN